MPQYSMESTKKNSSLTTHDRRFIDDVIGIWCPNRNPQLDAVDWNEFKQKMNAFPGLTWEFSEQSKTVDFMDMTITINNSNIMETTLFEKRLNLHLYIPHILPTLQGYSRGLCTALCFEFLHYVPLKQINYSKQRFFQMLNCTWLQRRRNSRPFQQSNHSCKIIQRPTRR